jgi:uncharacterized membrane protein
MKPWRWAWPAVVVASAVAMVLLTFKMGDSPLRPFVALWFLLVCPGVTLAGMVGIPDGLTRFVLGVAISVALETVAGLAMAYAGVWRPGLLLAGLVLFCVVAGGYQLLDLVLPRQEGVR